MVMPSATTQGVRSVAFTPDGRYLAAADDDRRVYIWDLASYEIVELLSDSGSQGIHAVAFSRNGRLVAAADGDGKT